MVEAVQPPRSSPAPLESRLEFETLISDTSAELFAAPPGLVERAVERALDRVRRFFEADLCGLLRVDPAARHSHVQALAVAEGVTAPPPEVNLAELFPWEWQRLVVERLPVRVARIDDLPPEAAPSLPAWRQLGTRSALTLPIETRGEVRYLVVIQTIRQEREWPDAFLPRLRVLGELLASALERGALVRELQAAEERVSMAASAAGAGLWVFDYERRSFWVTDRTRTLFDFSPDEPVSAESVLAAVHPEDRPAVEEALWRRAPASIEYRIVRRDGLERWISSSGRPLAGSAGGQAQFSGVSIDITDRKLADEALRRSEARLATGAELAGLAHYELDYHRGVAFADDRFYELCGVPPAGRQALGPVHFWVEHIHPEDRPRVLHLREQLHDGRLERLSAEYRYLHPIRGQRWIHHLAGVSARDASGRVLTTYGVFRDITEIKRAAEEVSDLSRRLISAHEDERAFLARELHDDVSQRLAVLAIEVGQAERAAGDRKRAAGLRKVGEGLARLSEDVHSLAYSLHPSILDELGLEDALRATCERQAGLTVLPDLGRAPADLGKEAALCLFRVAQEALNNASRHAGAKVAWVELHPQADGLRITVRDNGVGFDPAASRPRRSLGLSSMYERVRLLRGTLEIESAPGHGTVITAWVPARGAST